MKSTAIKIGPEKYKRLKGNSWPEYENYLNNVDALNKKNFAEWDQDVPDEITSFEKNFKYPVEINYLNDESHSQAKQDYFVIAMLEGKKNGYYLELGASDPIFGNNTYYLEKFYNWKGTSIEINNFEHIWEKNRQNKLTVCDALNFDYNTIPYHCDYLQVDIDPATNNLLILKQLLISHKFSVITFEHDIWRNTEENNYVAACSRKLLQKNGYTLIVNNIAIDPESTNEKFPVIFEDWWIHSDYVKKSVVDAYSCFNDNFKYPNDILFNRN